MSPDCVSNYVVKSSLVINKTRQAMFTTLRQVWKLSNSSDFYTPPAFKALVEETVWQIQNEVKRKLVPSG